MSEYSNAPTVSIIGWQFLDAVAVARELRDAGYLFVELRAVGCEMNRHFVIATHPKNVGVRLHVCWNEDLRSLLVHAFPLGPVVA